MHNMKMIRKMMFLLLPAQILLAVVGTINNLVSTYFASNYVGVDALSAVGLYSPLNMFLNATGTLLSGGCAIICGKLLGQNDHKKLQGVFSLDLIVASIIGLLFALVLGSAAALNQTSFFTKDPVVRNLFNQFLLGQVIGMVPTLLSAQLPVFLAMENQNKRTFIASLVYIFFNLIFNVTFVLFMKMGIFGVALSSSLGMWIFIFVAGEYFVSKKSELKYVFHSIPWQQITNIISIGFPGAASFLYQTVRGLIVNRLLEARIGSVGLSAFAGANNIMGLFWAIPSGMVAVSRLLMGISIGEEDRRSLIDVMKGAMWYYVPLMALIDVGIILCANPLTYLLFKDTSSQVFTMAANGLRILPLCMPFSVMYLHFVCYGQSIDRKVYINVLALLDGVICVVVFSYLLIHSMGINGVYVANVLNGVITTIYIIAYAWIKLKRMPKSIEDLMVIPKEFGAPEENRIDISLNTMEEVVHLAEKIQAFCKEKGIDERRAYLAALAMEEMAGNIVSHGFTKDHKKHTIDVRVVYKDEDVIMRIKDDCIPFDPKERKDLTENEDITKNIGIRMVYRIAKKIDYQNLLGLNVLQIRI